MKIGIISDIHGNSYGLKKVLSKISTYDQILCAGDISGFYPFVDEVVDLLKKYKVVSVLGNHDQYLLDGKAPNNANQKVKKSVKFMQKITSKRSLKYLATLNSNLNFKISGKKILMCHGSPWNLLEERIYPDYANFERFSKVDFDVIILGHTHYPMIRKVVKKMIINSGSCGQPRDYNMLSYIIWDTHKDTFENKRVEWDIENFKKEALARGTSPELFEVFNR